MESKKSKKNAGGRKGDRKKGGRKGGTATGSKTDADEMAGIVQDGNDALQYNPADFDPVIEVEESQEVEVIDSQSQEF